MAQKQIEATIGFSKGIGIGFNIIGRKDIFESFTVCFKEREKCIEFSIQICNFVTFSYFSTKERDIGNSLGTISYFTYSPLEYIFAFALNPLT